MNMHLPQILTHGTSLIGPPKPPQLLWKPLTMKQTVGQRWAWFRSTSKKRFATHFGIWEVEVDYKRCWTIKVTNINLQLQTSGNVLI